MRNWRDYLKARDLQNAGERQQAIAAFELLLERFHEDRDTVGIASVSKRIGNLYLDLDEPGIAAHHLLLARALEPRVDIRSTVTATLGRCYVALGIVDSVRWCVERMKKDATHELQRERGDDRATINARWLAHLADLLEPGTEGLQEALNASTELDAAILANADTAGFLIANDPAARVETFVLRARALMRLGRPQKAIDILRAVDPELRRCEECLPQRLKYLSVSADAAAALGDLRSALQQQQERAQVMAQNVVGRERLAVEQARAKALREQQEAASDRLLTQERAAARVLEIENRMQHINLVVMIGFVILFASILFVRARTRRRIQVEQLRTRLSRDLHDDIGSTLSSINILSTVARRKAEAGDEAGAAASMAGISERTQRLMRNMSDIVWSVDPDKDTMEELLVRMREFGAAVLEPKGINYRFDSAGVLNATLPPLLKSNLYLIFKEALNNAAKHAHATKVNASFTHENNTLRMTIADNGKGMEASNGASKTSGGNGLRNMQARALEMKAELRVISTSQQGTTIELVVAL